MRKVIRNVKESPEDKIKRLEEEKLNLQLALAETIEKQVNDKIEMQLALAEAVEMFAAKGGD